VGGAKIHGRNKDNTLDLHRLLCNQVFLGHTISHSDKLDEKTDRNARHDDGADGAHDVKIHGQDRCNTLDHYHPLCNLGYGGHTTDHSDKLDEKTGRNVHHYHAIIYVGAEIHLHPHHVILESQLRIHVNNHDVAIYEYVADGSHDDGGGAKNHYEDRYNILNHHYPLRNLESRGHTTDHHLDKLDQKTGRNVNHDVAIYVGAGIHLL